MNPIASRSGLSTIPERHQGSSPLASLPDDVLPNIFSRLPEPELFALPFICKSVQQSTQPILRNWAESELHATLKLEGPQRWDRLLEVLRNGAQHIRPDIWQNFLKAAKGAGLRCGLIQLALLAPDVAKKDAKIRQITESLPLDLDEPTLEELAQLSADAADDPTLEPITTRIIAGGFFHLMHAERERGSNFEAKWFWLEKCMRTLDPLQQMDILLQLRPSEQDIESTRLAFDGLLATHLDALLNKEANASHHVNFSCFIRSEANVAYFRMMSTAYTMKHSPQAAPYLESLFLNWLIREKRIRPWRENTAELCSCALRVLALTIYRNEDKAPIAGWMVERKFFTLVELNDFRDKLKSRMAASMPLEDAVSLWMADNRAQKIAPADSCVIS